MRLSLKTLLVTAAVVSGCSVVSEEKKQENPQKIEFGLMSIDSDMAAKGTMVAWDNTVTSYPLKSQWTHGIEFSFDLSITQPVYLYLDSDQNFDCDAGAMLMGPSYYLKFADGTETVFDYEARANMQNFPGKGDADYPGLVPAGNHRLVARWFSNAECRMDVSVAAKDRFAPKNNSGPAIQRADLLGKWSAENRNYDYALSGLLTVTDNAEPGSVVFDVYDFPYHSRYSATVKAVNGAVSDFAVGEVYYCAYDISEKDGTSLMTLGCNTPGDTSVPDTAKDPMALEK